MTSSTRSLRNLRSVSPGADELAPTEPLPAQALNQLCTVVREKLLVAQGERPSVRVRAVFRRKDEPNEPTQMLLNCEGHWSSSIVSPAGERASQAPHTLA